MPRGVLCAPAFVRVSQLPCVYKPVFLHKRRCSRRATTVNKFRSTTPWLMPCAVRHRVHACAARADSSRRSKNARTLLAAASMLPTPAAVPPCAQSQHTACVYVAIVALARSHTDCCCPCCSFRRRRAHPAISALAFPRTRALRSTAAWPLPQEAGDAQDPRGQPQRGLRRALLSRRQACGHRL